MHCALSGTAGFLSYQQFNGIQHHKVDGIDQVIPPLVPLALAAPLAVIQQQRDGRQHGEAGPQGAVGLHHEEQGQKSQKQAPHDAGIPPELPHREARAWGTWEITAPSSSRSRYFLRLWV